MLVLELRFMQSSLFLGSECNLRSRAGLKVTPKGGEVETSSEKAMNNSFNFEIKKD